MMLSNPSLNTDVTHAGLRPRSGPPVSLLRWASQGKGPLDMPYVVYT
jgi:hypothetical protein